MNGRHPQFFNQQSGVLRQGFHIVPIAGDLALALAAMVERDAAKAAAERFHLELPHLGAPEEPVREDDRLPASAGVLDVHLRAVDLHER